MPKSVSWLLQDPRNWALLDVVKPESNSTCGYILSSVPGPFAGCDSHSPGKGPGRTESGAKLWDQFEDQTSSQRLDNIILHIFPFCVCASLSLLECPKSAELCSKNIVPIYVHDAPLSPRLAHTRTHTFIPERVKAANRNRLKPKFAQGLSSFALRHLNVQGSLLDEHTSFFISISYYKLMAARSQ